MKAETIHKAFMVTVYHPYFKDGRCNCLSFTPAPETRTLLKRFHCFFENTGNHFRFYINAPESISAILSHIENATGISHFTFEIRTADPAFCHFTNYPTGRAGQLMFDTHDEANVWEDAVLHLSEKQADTPDTGLIGMLRVHFSDIIHYSSTRGFAEFAIRFKQRSTQWQYFIINKSEYPLGNPVVTATGGDIVFTGPEMVVTRAGQQALFFSSGEYLIPLTEQAGQTFSLSSISSYRQGQTGLPVSGKTIIKTLPRPRPGQFGIVEVKGEQQFSSPMYVFI